MLAVERCTFSVSDVSVSDDHTCAHFPFHLFCNPVFCGLILWRVLCFFFVSFFWVGLICYRFFVFLCLFGRSDLLAVERSAFSVSDGHVYTRVSSLFQQGACFICVCTYICVCWCVCLIQYIHIYLK